MSDVLDKLQQNLDLDNDEMAQLGKQILDRYDGNGHADTNGEEGAGVDGIAIGPESENGEAAPEPVTPTATIPASVIRAHSVHGGSHELVIEGETGRLITGTLVSYLDACQGEAAVLLPNLGEFVNGHDEPVSVEVEDEEIVCRQGEAELRKPVMHGSDPVNRPDLAMPSRAVTVQEPDRIVTYLRQAREMLRTPDKDAESVTMADRPLLYASDDGLCIVGTDGHQLFQGTVPMGTSALTSDVAIAMDAAERIAPFLDCIEGEDTTLACTKHGLWLQKGESILNIPSVELAQMPSLEKIESLVPDDEHVASLIRQSDELDSALRQARYGLADDADATPCELTINNEVAHPYVAILTHSDTGSVNVNLGKGNCAANGTFTIHPSINRLLSITSRTSGALHIYCYGDTEPLAIETTDPNVRYVVMPFAPN
ncbi:MAG: hypothetical protein ABEL51_15755 [Salinibacter sp.]